MTFANVVACICLFIVLGGDSLAQDATSAVSKLWTGKNIKNRSLTAADIRKSTLTGAEIKNRSLTAADFRGSLAGPQGARGPKGDPGAAGPIGPAGPAGPPGPVEAVDSAKIADGSVAAADLQLPWALSGSFGEPTLSITGSGPTSSGPLLKSVVDTALSTRPALYGETTSQFSNFGTAGVYGRSSGTGGVAGLFYADNPGGSGAALMALANGNGNGLTANANKIGDGVETTAGGSGSALYAWTPNFGTGRAARIVNFNAGNANPPLTVETHGTGNIAVFRQGDPGAVNRARIDATGKGFFNGGTQASGADLAEVVRTCSAVRAGQVVEIDPDEPDCFRVATTAGTPRVAGVISTEPGMTLGAADTAKPGPALALAGRVPVHATAERGPIRIGDLLVAADRPGYAMQAPADPPAGTVIGKALEPLARGTGSITMLVMSR